MTDSRHAARPWRRLAGTILFDGSLVAGALGIARWVFGVSIDLPPGPLPLGAGGPWPMLALAVVLFLAGASIAPVRRSAGSPAHRTMGDEKGAADGGALSPGPADLAAPSPAPTPMPRHREHL